MQMKLVRFRTLLESISSQLHLRNVSSVSSYSTSTPNLRTKRRGSGSKSMQPLFRRITLLSDLTVSIAPLLDQWAQEGRTVDKGQLLLFIKNLRSFKRYEHALQISMWMTDKRYFNLTPGDVATRLDLIAKVQGIEQAENYFNDVPQQLRALPVYSALLNCYANAKFVEKAEVTMQKMRDLGMAKSPVVYNSLLNLYYQNGNYEKLDSLMHEMEEQGISCDKITFAIRLSAYAATSNAEGIDNIVTLMESDPSVVLDWASYATAASGYVKAGCLDKAFSMLKKSEGLIMGEKSGRAYDFLIKQYAAYGKKEEVVRLWELYKKNMKVCNRSYISVIHSLLKFDDLEGAEKIFEEWDAQYVHFDIRIINFLIGAYCSKGFLQRAETLINRAKLKGGNPDAMTWFYMATGYLKNDQIPRAVEAMKEALVVCRNRWKPSKECLAVSLKYLEDGGRDIKGADNFIKLLREKDIISEDLQDRWLNNLHCGKLNFDALSELYGDVLIDNSEAPSESEDDSNHSRKIEQTY